MPICDDFRIPYVSHNPKQGYRICIYCNPQDCEHSAKSPKVKQIASPKKPQDKSLPTCNTLYLLSAYGKRSLKFNSHVIPYSVNFGRLWRYMRLIVNLISSWTFKPIRPALAPTFTAQDVTVLVPTLGDSDDFPRCLRSIVACLPKAIIIVTPKTSVVRVREKCDSLGLYDIQILGAEKANKVSRT